VRRCGVKVGRLIGEQLEIVEGLSVQERVVTAGMRHLHEGMLVRVSAEFEKKEQ
jgi:hypothetical protein